MVSDSDRHAFSEPAPVQTCPGKVYLLYSCSSFHSVCCAVKSVVVTAVN